MRSLGILGVMALCGLLPACRNEAPSADVEVSKEAKDAVPSSKDDPAPKKTTAARKATGPVAKIKSKSLVRPNAPGPPSIGPAVTAGKGSSAVKAVGGTGSPPAGVLKPDLKDANSPGITKGVKGSKGASTPEPPRLAAGMNVKLVKAVTKYNGSLRPGPLAGGEVGPAYDYLRLQPVRRDKLGVTFQVWRVVSAAARNRRFDSLRSQYPSPKASKGVGDRSFRSSFGDTSYLVWMDKRSRSIAAIGCSNDVCAKAEHLTAMAKQLGATIQ